MSKRNARRSRLQRKRAQFRGICWLAVAAATLLALQPGTDSGSATVGLMLAATLAATLVITKR